MVNTEKTIKRERTRLRRSQNPQQLDFKRMRKAALNDTSMSNSGQIIFAMHLITKQWLGSTRQEGCLVIVTCRRI